ncbi:hypothetical protein PCE1_003196 [Barthelona sp. PCE]
MVFHLVLDSARTFMDVVQLSAGRGASKQALLTIEVNSEQLIFHTKFGSSNSYVVLPSSTFTHYTLESAMPVVICVKARQLLTILNSLVNALAYESHYEFVIALKESSIDVLSLSVLINRTPLYEYEICLLQQEDSIPYDQLQNLVFHMRCSVHPSFFFNLPGTCFLLRSNQQATELIIENLGVALKTKTVISPQSTCVTMLNIYSPFEIRYPHILQGAQRVPLPKKIDECTIRIDERGLMGLRYVSQTKDSAIGFDVELLIWPQEAPSGLLTVEEANAENEEEEEEETVVLRAPLEDDSEEEI